MAAIEGGISGELAGVGAQTAQGLHVINKPDTYGALGEYVVSVASGNMAAGLGAGADIFHFRWNSPVNLALIKEIRLLGMRTSVAFAAGNIDIAARQVRGWSADGSGGAGISLLSDASKLRTSMATTGMIGRISTTAALTNGTRTVDTNNLGLICTHSSAGWQSATPIIGSIYLPTTELFLARPGTHPIVLAQNEGFCIQATVPATGVWNFSVGIRWAEVSAY